MKFTTINVLKYVKKAIEHTVDHIAHDTIEQLNERVASGAKNIGMNDYIQNPERPFLVGAKTWYKNGKWHNENGPASISTLLNNEVFAQNGMIDKIVQNNIVYEFSNGNYIGTKK